MTRTRPTRIEAYGRATRTTPAWRVYVVHRPTYHLAYFEAGNQGFRIAYAETERGDSAEDRRDAAAHVDFVARMFARALTGLGIKPHAKESTR